jgi:hypothetical protein
MIPLFEAFKTTLLAFKQAPSKHIFATLFLFLGAMTGLFIGVAIMAYFWFLSRPVSSNNIPPFTPFMDHRQRHLLDVVQFSQRLFGPHRLFTLSALGAILWIFTFIDAFGFHHTFLGTPLYWYCSQPILLLMMFSDAYAIDLKIATKATLLLFQHAPKTAGALLLTNFLAFSGMWPIHLPLGGVERYFSLLILVTFPLAFRTSLTFFRTSAPLLNRLIQKAYQS